MSTYTESLHVQLREIHGTLDKRKAEDNFDHWIQYGSGITDYQRTFSETSGGINIVDFLRGRLSPVVIDLMAPPQTLVSLFKQLPQKSKLGLAVSLGDLRSDEEKRRDDKLNIHQVAGDITQSSAWKAINKELKGKKADLIMERALEGLYLIPHHKIFYAIMINKLWKILSEDRGIILMTTPVFSDYFLERFIPIPNWVNHLKDRGVDAYWSKNSGVLRIVKEAQSPKILPFPQ